MAVDIEYLPDYLRVMRERAGITQGQLAQKVGCRTSSISHWESGARQPSYGMIRDLAHALGYRAQITFISGGKNDSTTNTPS